MVKYTTAETDNDLEGILSLQNKNLSVNISPEEKESQGFVTVRHSFGQLKRMNDLERHVIAKDGERVVGYVLSMTASASNDIAILFPMFEAFRKAGFDGKKIIDYHYLIVGQVCIDKNYRGKGVFKECYFEYKRLYREKYEFAVTEIAGTNLRSLNAHKKMGFEQVYSYYSPDDTQWIIVLWDWRKRGRNLS